MCYSSDKDPVVGVYTNWGSFAIEGTMNLYRVHYFVAQGVG